MKVGDRVIMSEENLKRWPKLKGKKLVIWHTQGKHIWIKVGKEKDYMGWDKDWFIFEHRQAKDVIA